MKDYKGRGSTLTFRERPRRRRFPVLRLIAGLVALTAAGLAAWQWYPSIATNRPADAAAPAAAAPAVPRNVIALPLPPAPAPAPPSGTAAD